MFERKHEKVASLQVFTMRMLKAVGLSVLMVLPALLIGVAGYHWIDHLDWVDAVLEASMILGGMGPISPLHNDAAKLFAAGYALFSGLVLIGVTGVILTPLAHRVLHHFHVED